MDNGELLKVKNLCIDFPVSGNRTARVVNDISFNIKKGEFFSLVGESGCGKTMSSYAIMNLVPKPGRVTADTLQFKDKKILELSYNERCMLRGNEISMIFQEPMTALNPVFTVGNQVSEAIILHQKVHHTEARKRGIDIFHKVGISSPEKRYDEYPHQLSGGMKQRVVIAMAMSCNPDLLIADEPTTALDVTIQAQILDLIKEAQAMTGMAVLFITHDLGVVAEMADRVAVMYAGRIVEMADKESLFRNPKHPYTKGLMRSIPSMVSRGKDLYEIPGVVPRATDKISGCRFRERCQEAMDICKAEVPVLNKLDDKRKVSCHLFKE
jgi:peptide/nickel transport system ATP-binding protein